MARSRHGDGPQRGGATPRGTAARTTGAARPDQGRSQHTAIITVIYEDDVHGAADALLALLRSSTSTA